jgi:hypothetical protein
MDANLMSLQQPKWLITEWRAPEIFQYQEMYWSDWQRPGYLLMKSHISVHSLNLSCCHLRGQDSTLLNNNTTKIQCKEKHSSVHRYNLQSPYGNTTGHNEYDTEQNITEHNKDKDLRKEDRHLISEYKHEDFDHFANTFFDTDTGCNDMQYMYVVLTVLLLLLILLLSACQLMPRKHRSLRLSLQP